MKDHAGVWKYGAYIVTCNFLSKLKVPTVEYGKEVEVNLKGTTRRILYESYLNPIYI